MSNKMNFEFAAIILATALLATVSITPLNYSAAQNAAMPQTEDTITAGMIASKIDQFKSEHPAFAAVLDKVQSMDAAQTLKAVIATHALERMLDAHAGIILHNAAGSMQNNTMPQTTEDSIIAGLIASKVDQLKSEHPAFAAVLDKVQSMDAAQTLKAIIGTHALERMLDTHAKISILQNATGAMQNATGAMQNATGVMQNTTSTP